VSKDRARPFSRKHRRYWFTVTGGMVLIGIINVSLGYCSYDPPGEPPKKIEVHIPPPSSARDAGIAPTDAPHEP
jgi:hypothetical protein